MHDHELASRQAALQKALSTALLNHQISELESKVQSIQVSKQRDSTTAGKVRVAKPEGPAAKRNGTAVNDVYKEEGEAQGRPAGFGRIDDDPADAAAPALTHDEDIEPEDLDDEEDGEQWRVVVLDASALIWALRSVRRLSSKGWEMVIPLDAIRTLDLLKKGSSHAAIGARAATRYIEHATRQFKLLSSDPSITVQERTNHKRGLGLRLQRDDEYIPVADLCELPIPVDDVPRWASNVLSCAGFFDRVNQIEIANVEAVEPRPTLFVANPPLAVEALTADEAKDYYSERAEGYFISQEAERFELLLEVLRDEEIEDMSFDPESQRGDRGRGRGRGRGKGRGGGEGAGRGGRGGRHGGEPGDGGRGRHERRGSNSRADEPEREFKILLRRPTTQPGTDEAMSNGRGSHETASPSTVLSALPVVAGSAGDLKGSPLAQPPVVGPPSALPNVNGPSKPNGRINGDDTHSERSWDRHARQHHHHHSHEHGEDAGNGHGRRGRGAVDGRGGRGTGGRGGRGGREGPPSPGRGGFVLLQRPGPPRPPPDAPGPAGSHIPIPPRPPPAPLDGAFGGMHPPPPPRPPRAPQPHHSRPPNGHHRLPPPPGPFLHLGPPPPPPGPPHLHHAQSHGPPPPPFEPRHYPLGPSAPEFRPRGILSRPPGPPGPPGPPRDFHPPHPPPFRPPPHGADYHGRPPPHGPWHGGGGHGFPGPFEPHLGGNGPKKVVLLQRPKG